MRERDQVHKKLRQINLEFQQWKENHDPESWEYKFVGNLDQDHPAPRGGAGDMGFSLTHRTPAPPPELLEEEAQRLARLKEYRKKHKKRRRHTHSSDSSDPSIKSGGEGGAKGKGKGKSQ